MVKPRKVFFFFSNVIDSPIYRGLLDEFSSTEFELHCIFLGEETLPLYNYSRNLPIESMHIAHVSKDDFVKPLFQSAWQLLKTQPKIVITFGQTASMIGLASSLITCKARRVYLRMHSSMNRVENFSRGVLYDRISNRLANEIVVPNENTKEYLATVEQVVSTKITKIEFGFNLSDLLAPTQERVQRIQEEYSLTSDTYVIGIVSRFTPVKGLQYSLPAVTNFLKRNPKAILLFAGVGNDPPIELKEAISGISPNQVRLISRVNDMAAYYHCLNVFVHTPIDETVESFGLVYVEAFAAGVPAIITLSGIAKDIAVNEENCLIVDYCNEQEIEAALDTLSKDADLSRTLSLNARTKVSSFTLEKMCRGYRDLIERV